MVIHTFFFRWKPDTTDAQKQQAHDTISRLHTQIPGIIETNVGVNFSPRSQGYQFAGVMKFKDRDALDAYGTHPVHLELLSWLMPLIDPIEVDFET